MKQVDRFADWCRRLEWHDVRAVIVIICGIAALVATFAFHEGPIFDVGKALSGDAGKGFPP